MSRRLIVWIFVFLLVPVSFAQIMEIDYDAEQEAYTVIPHYHNQYYEYTDHFEEDPEIYFDKTLVLVDNDGNSLYEDLVLDTDFYKILPGFAGFKIVEDGKTVLVQSVTLCNNNGVCEPCYEPGCSVAETSAVCSDCPSGGRDGFCDIKRDGICDPDCEDMDADCAGCGPCYYDDMTCESVGGVFCDWGQECVNGYFDNGLFDVENDLECCRFGACGSFLEAVEVQAQAVYHPEYFDLNVSEKPVATCAEAGGTSCDWTADCDGEWAYTEEDSMCCIGSCFIPSEVKASRPEDFEYISEEEEKTLYGSEKVLLNETEPHNLSNLNVELENWYQLSKDIGEKPKKEFEPDFDMNDPESYDSSSIDLVDYKDQIKTFEYEPPLESEIYILGFEPLTFFITLAMIIILIIGFIITFVIKERRSPTPAIKSNENLQADINSLVAKGLNYQQIQTVLVQKGFSSSLVNQEIKKNYYQRKGE